MESSEVQDVSRTMSDMEIKENIVEEHKHASIDISYKETRMEKSFKISILLVTQKKKMIKWRSLTKV